MVEQVRETRAPAYALRLEHIQDASVFGVCYLCRHESKLNVQAFITKWGRHEWVKNIEKLLRCTNCGATEQGVKLRVEYS